jgi:hypothetical protein
MKRLAYRLVSVKTLQAMMLARIRRKIRDASRTAPSFFVASDEGRRRRSVRQRDGAGLLREALPRTTSPATPASPPRARSGSIDEHLNVSPILMEQYLRMVKEIAAAVIITNPDDAAPVVAKLEWPTVVRTPKDDTFGLDFAGKKLPWAPPGASFSPMGSRFRTMTSTSSGCRLRARSGSSAGRSEMVALGGLDLS